MEVRDTAVIDLMNALEEMFPEMGAGERSMMARQLADEYMRERGAAKAELRPKHPQAPPTEQMQFDEAWGEMRDQEALAGRTQKRINAALRDEGRPRAPKMGDARPIMPQGQGEPYGDEPVAFDGFHRGKQRDDDNYRREQQKRRELQTAREMALGAEREVFRKTGQRGPTQHDEARRRTQRKANVEQFPGTIATRWTLPDGTTKMAW
jgi:hypothetical protein